MNPNPNSSDTANWFDDDSFWSEMFPFMFPEQQFAAAAQHVPQITTLTGISSGNLLDLACGPGRYAVPFALAGFQVTGVDRTQFLLDEARRRASQAGATVQWVHEDMRQFVRPASFNLAINLFTSFGYFDDPAENLRVLQNLYDSLKPGGTFVFDHLGKEVLAARFQPTRSTELADGRVLVNRTRITHDWSRVDDEWTLIASGRTKSFRIGHWIYSGREFRELLASVGFNEVALYGTFEGTPYDPQAQRLIAVARKPTN